MKQCRLTVCVNSGILRAGWPERTLDRPTDGQSDVATNQDRGAFTTPSVTSDVASGTIDRFILSIWVLLSRIVSQLRDATIDTSHECDSYRHRIAFDPRTIRVSDANRTLMIEFLLKYIANVHITI